MSAAMLKGRDEAMPLVTRLIAAGKEAGDHEAVFCGAISLLAGALAGTTGFDTTLKVLRDCIDVVETAKRKRVD